MSNLLNYLILGITFCLTIASNDATEDIRTTINQTIAIEVEVELPWFIKFKFPIIKNFEPLHLSVSVSRPGETRARLVGFNAQNETKNQRIFRNTDPLRLYEGDVIYVILGYMGDLEKPRSETELSRTEFTYVINKKQFDTITIVVQILADPRTKLKEEEEDAEYDSVEQTTIKAINEGGAGMNCQNATTENQQPPMLVSCTSMENEHGYTAELLKTAEEIGQIGARLLLKGNNKSPGSNAVDVIKSFIMDKLRLSHVAEKVLQARFINSSVLFEVATTHDKLEVLTKARLCLRQKNRIESTTLNFNDTQHY